MIFFTVAGRHRRPPVCPSFASFFQDGLLQSGKGIPAEGVQGPVGNKDIVPAGYLKVFKDEKGISCL